MKKIDKMLKRFIDLYLLVRVCKNILINIGEKK